MVDNKNIPSQIVSHLRHLTFEQQADVWERNCSKCPFATVRTIENNVIEEHKNIDEARANLLVEYNEKYILRGCNFADQDLSLLEICMNTCRFWKVETCEGGSNQPDQSETALTELSQLELTILDIRHRKVYE